MSKRSGKAPKLHAKGTEARNLVPFSYELALAMEEHSPTMLHKALVALMYSVFSFYMTFGAVPYDKTKAIKRARQFCILYKSIGDRMAIDKHWKIKPKFHVFLELTEFQSVEHEDP